MRKIIFCFFALFSLFFAYGEISFYCPDKIIPGDPFKIVVYQAESGEDISGGLYTLAGKRLTEAASFPLRLNRNIEVDIILLGVPCFLSSDEYLLRIFWKENNSSCCIERKIKLSKRSFVSEDIKLDRANTVILTKPDPRKAEERREFNKILGVFDVKAVFCDECFVFPVKNFVETSFYGDRRVFLYDDGKSSRSIHYGLDMASDTGTPVRAPADGRVVYAKERIVTGNSVIIEHLPGVFSIYFHMDSLKVKKGDMVSRGRLIGTVGSTGLSTGSHLHWQINISGVPVEPKTLLKAPLIDKSRIMSRISSLSSGELTDWFCNAVDEVLHTSDDTKN